jgi:glycosyltransferase involved in cell wall biosynthesis
MLAPNHPLISVLLPVYNGAEYLTAAIESILSQTYRNFELIIINDGSHDDSAKIISQFGDSRIRAYLQNNQGLAASLNRAVQLAKGKYLARQDQDDFSLPQRFQRQVEFLESHEECGMVGTWAKILSENKTVPKLHSHPSENAVLKFELLFDNPFVHSSMMIRKVVFDRVGLYSTDRARQPPEDYELWSRVARKFEVANMPEVLHIYRDVPSSMSKGIVNPFLENVIKISSENFSGATGRDKNDLVINDLVALSHGAYDKVSGRPTLRELSFVLSKAAEYVSNNNKEVPATLNEKVQLRLENLRNHYLGYKKNAGMMCRLKGFVRRM